VRVSFLIGLFSKEREKSIQLSWNDLTKASPGEGAKLHFEQLPVEIRCLDFTKAFYLEEEIPCANFVLLDGCGYQKGKM